MNDKVKMILGIAKSIAPVVFPPSGPVIGAVEKIVRHEGDLAENVGDVGGGVLAAYESLKDDDIADEVQFRAGIMLAVTAERMIQQSLRKPQA